MRRTIAEHVDVEDDDDWDDEDDAHPNYILRIIN